MLMGMSVIMPCFAYFVHLQGPMASITWGYRGTHNPTTMTHVLLGKSAHKEVSILDIWHPIVSI